MNYKKIASSSIIVLVFSLILSGCSSQYTPTTTQPTEQSNAFKLASLEIGYNDPSQELQDKFQSILTKLKLKCPNESEDDIANYIFKTKTMIEDKGGQISLVESANAIDESLPTEAAGSVTCAEVAAAFVTLYTN